MVERVADISGLQWLLRDNATPSARALVERGRVLIDRRILAVPGAVGLI
jgi:hypothetical protein